MKGRVRRCIIEGTIPEIKTNYISYLEPFLIWFCEKEQHKEGERRAVHGGRADSLRTVRGGCADRSRTVRGWHADNSWMVHGGRADCSRIDAQTTLRWHANSAEDAQMVRGGRADNSQTTRKRHANSTNDTRERPAEGEWTMSGRWANGVRTVREWLFQERNYASECWRKWRREREKEKREEKKLGIWRYYDRFP